MFNENQIMMKKIYKLLFPIALMILFFALNALENLLTSRIDWRLEDTDTSSASLIILSACSCLTIMLSSYYICFSFFNRKRTLIIYLTLISLLSLLAPIFSGYFEHMHLLRSLTLGIQFCLLGVAMYLLYDWYEKKQQTKLLKRQNLQSELALLKNQINPHFLFNTLNNIDSLIKSNPDKASHTLVELSGMMRYMIYDTNVEKAPLSKELEYIENYIEIQKLQYPNAHLVSYKVIGKPDNISVAPMMFIPFIENAFKHCTDKERENAIRFSFDLRDDRKILFFAINIADATHPISKDESSGVGLDVVKRRLDLIYPKRHSLEIRKENDLFCVSLSIDV